MASQYAAGEDVTAAATVADNLLMAAYFFVLIFFAGNKWFRKNFAHPLIEQVEAEAVNLEEAKTQAAAFWSRKDISLKDIAINIAYASTVVWASRLIANLFANFEITNVFMNFVVRFLGSHCFISAKIFKFNLEDAIIASNANIGGPTTAAGMAISQGWVELVGPAMLIGTLGYVIGNYLGTIVAVSLGL